MLENMCGLVLTWLGVGGGAGRACPRAEGLPYAFHAAKFVALAEALAGRMAGTPSGAPAEPLAAAASTASAGSRSEPSC